MRYRLRFAENVGSQVEAIDSWWRANRRASPTLFGEEFEASLERLEAAPLACATYGHSGQPSELRRLLLPRCRYFVYFEVQDDLVTVLALWHASRGKGPPL
jgi:plasmid stabilization system protein ParE